MSSKCKMKKKKRLTSLTLFLSLLRLSFFRLIVSNFLSLSLSRNHHTSPGQCFFKKKKPQKNKNKKKSSFWLLLLLSVLKFYLSLFYLCLSLFFIFPPSWIVDSLFFKTKNKIHLPICCPFFQKKKEEKNKKQNKTKERNNSTFKTKKK